MPDPALLMDTSRDMLMLAVMHAGELAAQRMLQQDCFRRHSAVLLPEIQAMLAEVGLTPQNLGSLVVNCGPGSFTGIRTGLTVARTMAQFLPVEAYGMDTFTLLAARPAWRGQTVAVALNAFRQQHYHAILRVSESGGATWLEPPSVRSNADFTPSGDVACYVTEQSLQALMPIEHGQVSVLEASDWFSPESMAFLLAKQPEAYRRPWQDLLPLYLQLPNITKPAAPRR